MNSITRAENIGVIEKTLTALELRRAGYDYVSIGKILGVTAATAGSYVRNALLQFVGEIAETAEEVRQIELARLDAMQRSLGEKLEHGDLAAINTALRVMERRARLLGLDKGIPQDIRSQQTKIVIEYKNDWRPSRPMVVEKRAKDASQNLIAESASWASNSDEAPGPLQVLECGPEVAEDDASDEHSDRGGAKGAEDTLGGTDI